MHTCINIFLLLYECKRKIESEKNQMCIKCKKNKRDCILFNCEHIVNCKECTRSYR